MNLARAAACFAEAAVLMAKAVAVKAAAEVAHVTAKLAALAAKGADKAASLASKAADAVFSQLKSQFAAELKARLKAIACCDAAGQEDRQSGRPCGGQDR